MREDKTNEGREKRVEEREKIKYWAACAMWISYHRLTVILTQFDHFKDINYGMG